MRVPIARSGVCDGANVGVTSPAFALGPNESGSFLDSGFRASDHIRWRCAFHEFATISTDRTLKLARSPIFHYSLLLVALALGGFAVAGLRTPWGRMPGGSWLWLLLVSSGLLGGLALRLLERSVPVAQPRPVPAVPRGRRQRRAGTICILAALIIVLLVAGRLWPDFQQWNGTFLPWIAALALTWAGGFLLGSVGLPSSPDVRAGDGEPRATLSREIPRWLEIGAFLLIAVVAILCRVYRLKSIPSGIYVDETNGALDALRILEGENTSPFGTAWYETPAGYVYYMAGMFKLFGANYWTLKAVSILPSVLAVLALYPLGRILFGPIAGLSAMALMAVSRWHMTMSRWGWNETAPLLFQILATYFLVRGLREARASSFVSGGLLTGLCAYTYLSSRIVFATLVVFCIYWLAFDPDGLLAGWRRHRRGMALFFLAFFIAVAPLAVTYATKPFLFLNRIREISVFNEVRELHSYRPVADNLVRHLKFFHQTGDLHGKHNLPGEPETDPVTGVLFVVGLGYASVRLRDRRRGLLWIWLAFAMLAGILSVRHEAPQAYRTLGAVPAIALLAGDTLARTGRGLVWVRRKGSLADGPPAPWRVGLAASVLFLALLAAGVWEIRIYFGRQARSTEVQTSFNLSENSTAHEVVDALKQNLAVYLSPRVYDYSPLRFLVYGVVKKETGGNALARPPYHLLRPETDLPVPATGTDALLLLSSTYWPVRDYLSSFYPAARVELIRGPDARPLYVRMRIPARMVADLQGLRRREAGDGARATEWSGGIRVAESGVYDFPYEAGRIVTVDEDRWSGERFLGRGLHDLSVSVESPAFQPADLRWRTPSGQIEPIPPQSLFGVRRPRLGLVGSYFANTSWKGQPLFRQLTPIMLLAWSDPDPIPGSFSARFTGSLRIPRAGNYHFRIEADDGVRLTLDGRVLAESLVPDRPNPISASSVLTAGDHPIEIDYFQNGGGSILEFFWQPPSSEETPVPPTALVPGE